MSQLAGTRHLDNADIDHRAAFVDYVMESAEDWHRTHLGRLYTRWEDDNYRHFAGELWAPYVLLSEPSEPKRYGDCARVSGFGGRLQIRLRPSLLTGTHPHIRGGADFAEGRFLFVADVLLHEMIHQLQQEVLGVDESGYHGHGPTFRDKANEIGDRLGLNRVRTNKRRGKDKELPSCSQWPHNVRDEAYYLGARVPSSGDKAKVVGVSLPITDIDAAVVVLLQHYDAGELCKRLQGGLDSC
jgi:hypothetical protein